MLLDLTKLEELKRLLTSAKQISAVMEYFFDHFAENPAFLDKGVQMPLESETFHILEAVIGSVASLILKKPGSKAMGLTLFEIPEYGFVHGVCFAGGMMLNLIYFDDLKTGAVAIAGLPGMPGADGTTHFSRFTTTPLKKPLTPMTALHTAPKKRTVH